jgi:hypothetical protein
MTAINTQHSKVGRLGSNLSTESIFVYQQTEQIPQIKEWLLFMHDLQNSYAHLLNVILMMFNYKFNFSSEGGGAQ